MKENNLNYSEFIERYLDGEMTNEELKWFEKEIEGNISLKNEILLRQKVNKALSETKIINYRKLLEEAYIDYTLSNKNRGEKTSIFKYYIVTFSILILVFIAINFFLIKISPDKIYKKFYETFPPTFTLRSINNVESSILKNAINEYSKNNFEKSAILFEQLLKTNKQSPALNFYAAISNMEIKKFEKAEKYFIEVINNKNTSIFKEESMWYLSLCYIAQNNINKAKPLLKEIIKNNGYYAEQAKKIVRRLK